MNELIERNRRLLHFYYEALRTIGFVILILGSVSGFVMAIRALFSKFGDRHVAEFFEKSMILGPLHFFKIFFIGIGILGLVQFIRYLVERNYKPGWILRHGEIIFYLYALLTILNDIWVYMNAPNYHSPSLYTRALVIFGTVFGTAVKVLVLVGLGRILRHLMPVIEESKSLV
jgi:hypothetical protein